MKAGASAIWAAGLLVLLGGCSGPAPTKGPADRVATTVLPTAPDVGKPLDASGVDACQVLQVAPLNAVRMEPLSAQDRTNDIATACTWQSSDALESLSLVINTNTSFDLLYSARDAAQVFDEFAVRGYPAVRENPQESAICTIYVALAPTQVFSTEFSTSATARPVRSCESAESAAGAVVDAIAARG